MNLPYCEFYAKELRPGILLISSKAWEQPTSNVNSWMILGDDKALLLDAGLPCTGLRAFAEHVAERPVMLALTHGHFDHAGALAEFDEFWMNPADERLLHGMAGLPATEYSGILYPLLPGDKINLGNRIIEIYGIQGHTEGSLVFLDKRTKTLFSGDSIARRGLFMEPESLPIDRYFDDLLSLEKLDFDAVGSAHDRFFLPKSQIRHFIVTMIDGIEAPDGEWKLPNGDVFLSIHVGDGAEDPQYISISIPRHYQTAARILFRDWKQKHLNWWERTDENTEWQNYR